MDTWRRESKRKEKRRNEGKEIRIGEEDRVGSFGIGSERLRRKEKR